MDTARLCLRVLTRPQRGTLTRLGRSCPVKAILQRGCSSHFRSAPSEGEICPRVRPEGRVKLVAPADG